MTYIRNRYFFLFDVILLPITVYLSYVLRLETFDLTGYWDGVILFAVLVLLVTPLVFWRVGVYTRYWRYASVEEVLLMFGAVTVSAMVSGSIGLMLVWLPWDNPSLIIPRSVPLIFTLVGLGLLATPRLVVRLITRSPRQGRTATTGIPVIIMGAGEAGAMIVRELQRNPGLDIHAVGFLDDDPAKRQARIHGVPVLGNRYDLLAVAARYAIQRVIIAMPTAPGKTIREIVHLCDQAGVQSSIIPGIYELIGGRISVNQLRTVQIEDLLRRAPVQTDQAAVQDLLYGKRVLITGGGGSIGSELGRQVLRCNPAQLVLVGHGENSIFEIGNELQHTLRKTWYGLSYDPPPIALHTVIADIRDRQRLQAVFETYQPEIVFHAAAHKHVPLMELNPSEAITNNVLGTRNVVTAALACGTERLVMISTDKAVNPTSVMGTTKRVAELLVHQAALETGRPYTAVRFGNVLGSRGSVVRTFKQQIEAGGPVTVTHPDIKRFFMTIPEAVQLVLQAAVLGQGGEVFLLDMGEPVKIVDLARDMIELSGLTVGEDVDIVFTGLRPGEKLFEELFIHGEAYQPTCHAKIFIALGATNAQTAHLDTHMEALTIAAQQHDRAEIIRLLRLLVSEYQPPQRETQIAPQPVLSPSIPENSAHPRRKIT